MGLGAVGEPRGAVDGVVGEVLARRGRARLQDGRDHGAQDGGRVVGGDAALLVRHERAHDGVRHRVEDRADRRVGRLVDVLGKLCASRTVLSYKKPVLNQEK